MKVSDAPIIVEQKFNVSTSTLWNALTDINEMRKWYFENIPDFKPVKGFTTKFKVVSGERVFIHNWEVVDVIPFELIKYVWSFDGYKGKSTSEFKILTEDNFTTLILTIIISEDFEDNIPEFERGSCIAGWNYFINEKLKNFLE
ncbi:MAG: SRPBCC domain-containing protein [Melioribacteraceae bacterium]|nr:SRPBCC domain-containing protein [Melioribacteraceae bacterium]